MIDLHTHSNASDGDLKPAALIDLAAETGITTMALTDHDTTAGLAEAEKRAKKRNIRLIHGMETEVDFRPGEFHLLGLNIKNYDKGPLAEFLEEIRRRRVTRNEEMIALMSVGGLEIGMEALDELAGGDVIGRLHVAHWLINHGHAKNIPDVFERYIGQGCPYYVPKNRPSLEEALIAIHAADGKAVIAHPLSLWISWGKLGNNLAEWKEMGLDGIEARHSGASKREASRLTELAEANDLIITGGSDFHGSGRPDRKLGRGAAGEKLKDSILEPFNDA